MHGNSPGAETSEGDGAEKTGRCSRRKIRPAAHTRNRIAVMQESFRCGFNRGWKKKHPAVMLLLLFAALGGRIPATVLLLLIAAHSVVSFTGGGKSSAGMAKDRRPSLLKTGAISI